MLRASLEIYSEGKDSFPEACSVSNFSSVKEKREHVTD